jgi:preprotein translocase SecE subunit
MAKDDATWLNVAYVTFFLIMGFIGYKAMELLGIQMGWVERYDWYGFLSTAVAAAFGIGLTLYLRSDPERHEYFLASIGELRKVTWPSWPDTKRMTIVVCIVVAIFAVIVGIFDAAWAWTLKHLIA